MSYFVIFYISSLMAHSVSLHRTNAIFYKFSNNDSLYGSCKLRTVREAMDQRSGSLMTESFILDDIEYKLCRYHVTWDEAQVFCSTHKAHLATLDNDEKTSFVVQAIAASNSHSEDYWIGARKYYQDLWTWDSNQKGLSSSMKIIDNIAIFYPGVESNDVRCLTIDRTGHDVPIFVPRSCNQQRGFICQRDTDRNLDNKIRMVAASKIGEEEFRLYSGRATWAEAVVQCREEGLQIAEVKSVAEARALAVSMLRNRPGIESAWIGGYTRKTNPGTWRWLASGDKIKDNEMWQKNFSQSFGGCLLLDRHLCEIPVYVEAKCDRKRDVLCQKTSKKRTSRQPMRVIVDGCSYWIGFYPLKWSEARRSCESMNASLVVLDSPTTISHMMSLMLDNRAELRHIWTDGRRSKRGQWRWQVNGQSVPAFGKSFMPWCFDDKSDYSNELNCLNLDRENPDTPLVYGLACNEKQSYVCQPRTGGCVSHLIASSEREPEVESSEEATISQLEIQRSGSSGTMSMGIEDYRATSTTLKTVRFLEVSLDDSDLEKNSSTKAIASGGNFSNYLTPLTRFTFPSLPQFGIKLASALETSTRPATKYENQRMKKVKEFFKTSPAPRKSTILSKLPTTPRKYSIDTRKSAQASQAKKDRTLFSTMKSTNFETTTSRRSAENLTTARPKSRQKTSTRKLLKTTPVPPKYFTTSTNPKIQKYSQKTTRQLITNSPPKFPPNTLKRITTPLPKKRKRLRLTTSSITPYDAVDKDYYDNYETTKVPKTDGDPSHHFDNEYEDDYDIPEGIEGQTQPERTSNSNSRKNHVHRKSPKKNKSKKKNREKFSIPIAGELSKSLQTALMDMLTKGVNRKMAESKNKTEISTTTLPEVTENPRGNVPFEKPSEKVKENWSIRPYYAFEGPMAVGLSGNSSQLENPENANRKTHNFKFVGKKVSDTSRKAEPRIPKVTENRRSNLQNSRINKNVEYRLSLPISGDLPIGNDPDVFLEMGRYFKNTFGHLGAERMEENQSHEGLKRGTGNNGIPQHLNTFSKNPRQENSNYDSSKAKKVNSHLRLTYDKNGRKINSPGKYYDAASLSPRSKSYEKSWQEKLKVSWPEETSANSKHRISDESVAGGNSPFPLRTTRSSGESAKVLRIDDPLFASLPDFKISKFVKEVKFDFDQESLRNYLETLADRISGRNDIQSEKINWKDSWKYILAQISKVLDRLNFNVNGDLLKINLGSNDEKETRMTGRQNSEQPNDRRNQNLLNFEKNIEEKRNGKMSSLESRERIAKKSRNRKFYSNSLENTDWKIFSGNRGSGDHSLGRGNAPKAMDSRNRIFQHNYQSNTRSLSNNRNKHFREATNGKKFKNRYTHQLVNFNDSQILVAPAIIRPIGSSEMYNFQPIMPQLHHRLAFNEGLTRFHPYRRTKNVSDKGFILKGEYLPRGTLSRIVRFKDPSDEFEKRDENEKQLENNSRPGNGTSSSRNSANKMVTSFLRLGNSNEFSFFEKFQKNQAIRYPDENLVTRISTNDSLLKEETNLQNNNGRSDNDRGRDEIVDNLEHLREEPSIVSLKMIMNPSKSLAQAKSREAVVSSLEIPESPKIVNLQLKFSGKIKKAGFQNGLNEGEMDKSERGKIFSRLREKIHKRVMIQKLRQMSRLFAMRNNSSSWLFQNDTLPVKTRLRKSQMAESAKYGNTSEETNSMKNYSVPSQNLTNPESKNSSSENLPPGEESTINAKRQMATTLVSHLRENNDPLTIYLRLGSGPVEIKSEPNIKSKT